MNSTTQAAAGSGTTNGANNGANNGRLSPNANAKARAAANIQGAYFSKNKNYYPGKIDPFLANP